MARYLKDSLNNAWDRYGDNDRPSRAVDSYFGKMTDERLAEYIASVSAQLSHKHDTCMAGNLRDAFAELQRRAGAPAEQVA